VLNSLTREWSYSKESIKIRLENTESTHSVVLKEKLINQAIIGFMPTEESVK
jgi:hypothetical protein